MSDVENAAADSGFDPAKVSERIKERVNQKMAAGFYNETELRKIEELNLRLYDEAVQAGYTPPRDEKALSFMNAHWDVTAPIPVVSPRGGVVTLFKKFYQKTFHRLMRPTLAMQADFNSSVVSALNAAHRALDDLTYQRRRYMELIHRIQAMEKATDDLDTRVGKLEGLSAQMENLRKALHDVDRQGIFLKNRITAILDKLAETSTGAVSKAISAERAKLSSHDYTLFENLHRGTREEIKKKLSVYAEWFKGADGVLDVGCGRGELLEIFSAAGIKASGVDINEEMVEECGRKGFDAVAGDAIAHLKALPDSSLGGISAIQFIEHLPVETMTEFFRIVLVKLRPGGIVAAETINPSCLTTFCGAFYLDMSHTKPVHPLAARFLLERTGFSEVRIEYLNPYPESIRLTPLPMGKESAWPDPELAVAFNANVNKLNNVLYSHTDYAVVARR